MTDEQIKHMVDRFLQWKLPENFNPDGGITFSKFGSPGTAHQYKNEPSGTNLLDATQADAMVRHMIEGMPESPAAVSAPLMERLCQNLAFHLIESELTLSHAEGDIEDWRAECDAARSLIKEAGFDIDVLYPILDRPSSDGPT